MTATGHSRRAAIGAGGVGVAGGLITGVSLIDPKAAYAQAAGDSLLRTVLDRGKLIVGTGCTNAPWHFEDEKGKLIGMDIAMARILAKGLFDDETKIEFVQQDAGGAHPQHHHRQGRHHHPVHDGVAGRARSSSPSRGPTTSRASRC